MTKKKTNTTRVKTAGAGTKTQKAACRHTADSPEQSSAIGSVRIVARPIGPSFGRIIYGPEGSGWWEYEQ